MVKIMNNLHGWRIPIISLLFLLFAIVSIFNKPSIRVSQGITPPPQAGYQRSIVGIGVVEPRSELIELGVDLPGVVNSINVVVGSSVKKGDVIFSLDQRDVDAQIKVLDANLLMAEAQKELAVAHFNTVEKINDPRAVSVDEYHQRKYAKEQAIANVAVIQAQIQQARTTKSRLSIVAPMDGEILQINIHPGEFAAAGVLPAPLVVFGDTSKLHVRVEFDEENAAHIDPNHKVSGYVRGDSATAIPMHFMRFEPLVLPKTNLAVAGQRVDTRVVQVLYALPPGIKIHNGQQMDVFVEAAAVNTKS